MNHCEFCRDFSISFTFVKKKKKKKHIENALTKIDKWDILNVHYKNHPIQDRDSYNCGLYVIYYVDIIGKNEKFNNLFQPDEYRRKD